MCQIDAAIINHRPKTHAKRRFKAVTVDETWIYYYTPKTKQLSKQWVAPGGSAPKKAMTVSSAERVMAIIFWDVQEIILIDYFQKGQTSTGEYHATLVSYFHEKLRMERQKLAHKKTLSHQDNTPAHTSAV